MSKLNVTNFGDCCGARVIFGFPQNVSSSTPKIVKEGLRKLVKDKLSDFERMTMEVAGIRSEEISEVLAKNRQRRRKGPGLYMVILTVWQERVFGDLFTDIGFTKDVQFHNPNSGNYCRVYRYLDHQDDIPETYTCPKE